MLWAVVAVAACKKHDKRVPDEADGPPVVASCDYQAEVLGGTNHRCFEIFDPVAVAAQQAWCTRLARPGSQPVFSRGRGCPLEGRHGGCLYPNGTIDWHYEGEHACIGGREFKTAPRIKVATPYRCATASVCRETMSVINLAATADQQSCESSGGVFELAMCSADDVVGRCTTKDRTRTTTWVYYASTSTLAQAKQQCARLDGVFTPQG